MYELLKQNKDLWNLFTSKEEYIPRQLDKYNGITYKNILEPKVSNFLIENGLVVEYPDNKKFAVCLTHDVDDVYPPLSHTVLSSLYSMKNLNFNELKNQLCWKYKGKKFSPYWNFKEIIKLEEKYEAKSSFYFIATDRDIRRFRYDIEDLGQELGSIIDAGWEVGLHGGYYSYNSLEKMKEEKDRLEKVLGEEVIGYRNHYLMFEVPVTWKLLASAGFKYDTTFGYKNMVGFRNGMCHPFKPFDLNNHEYADIIEIPLIIMDGALFASSNSLEAAWEKTKNLIDIVEKSNGVLTLLWHNIVFNSPFRDSWKKLYMKVLDYSYKKDAWIANGEEILRWWRNEY